jgi:hypothetical protein
MTRWLGHLLLLSAFTAGGVAFAEPDANNGRLAFNVWAGGGWIQTNTYSIGTLQAPGKTVESGFNFSGGLAVGYKFNSLVAGMVLGNYMHNFDNGADLFTPGVGFRLDLVVMQLMLSGAYAIANDAMGNGVAFKAHLFFPFAAGFGPYAEAGFHSLSGTYDADNILNVNAGVCYGF